MKFTQLHLSEVSEDFDISKNFTADTSASEQSFLFDDDFSDGIEIPEHSVENIPTGPKSGLDVGVADMIISAINSEWETIRDYNSIVASLRDNLNSNNTYADMIPVLNEIINEETRHVGQLQEVLKRISPNVESIEEGQKEAEKQFNFVNGKLPVQTMYPETPNNTVPNSEISDQCTITNIDDEI